MPKKVDQRFVSPDDPILIKIAEAIPSSDISLEETKRTVEQLLKIAYGERVDSHKPVLVGLAAPQVGISKRIILVDVGADGRGGVSDLRIYLNPEITWMSDEKEEWYEGCFSTAQVAGIVSRPKHIKLKASTPDGVLVEEEHSGETILCRMFLIRRK